MKTKKIEIRKVEAVRLTAMCCCPGAVAA